MFQGCSNLTNANNAISISNFTDLNCYKEMFYGCHGLLLAPTVKEGHPITDYGYGGNRSYAYYAMFQECSSLLDCDLYNMSYWYNSKDRTHGSTYGNMFKDCTSLNLSVGSIYGTSYINYLPIICTHGNGRSI